MSKYHNQNKMQPETNLSSYTIETTNTLIYQAMYPFSSNDILSHHIYSCLYTYVMIFAMDIIWSMTCLIFCALVHFNNYVHLLIICIFYTRIQNIGQDHLIAFLNSIL